MIIFDKIGTLPLYHNIIITQVHNFRNFLQNKKSHHQKVITLSDGWSKTVCIDLGKISMSILYARVQAWKLCPLYYGRRKFNICLFLTRY